MQRNELQGNEQTATIPKTLWAYVPCQYDNSRESKTKSSTFFSTFCCCFHNDKNRYPETNISVHFTAEDDTPVTLSQALLCLDNPQMPIDVVSYPISEEIILANHRSQNVLQQPHVIRSTQMLFMGYDIASLQGIDIHKSLSSNKAAPACSDYRESDQYGNSKENIFTAFKKKTSTEYY